MINTREEIVNGLVEATELEHGLMVQYLYAAMTLKETTDEGLTPAQLNKVKHWALKIRGVAKQEMGHLATALNLLEAVGGGSHLDRVRFPARSRFYKPPIPFTLEPLTLDTIQRFINFEKPVHPVMAFDHIAPEPVVFSQVGDLYGQIKTGILGIDEKVLFIGRGSAQDRSAWSFAITVSPVTDRASAVAAIDSIVTEGEGNSTGTDQSHYGRFKGIQAEYKAELVADPKFQPFRSVLSNPATQPGPDTTVIEVEDTLAAAELFSACYTTLLLCLAKYYRFDETDDNQALLQGIAKNLMIYAVAPLGSLLSKLPANKEKNAGPPFEIYTLPSLPHDRDASLKLIRERMQVAKAFATGLAARVTTDGVVQSIADQLDVLSQTLPV